MHAANEISAHFVGVFGGLTMSAIAFSIVFIVILGLMLIMMAMKHVGAAIDSFGKKPAATAAAPAAPAASSAPAQAAAVQGDDAELMAVISAVVMAVCGSAARVVSFSAVQAPAASTWKFVGRMQNAEGFQD